MMRKAHLQASTIMGPLTVLSREWEEFGTRSTAEVVKDECASESPGRLTKTQSAEPHPRVFDSWGLLWDMRSVLLTSSPMKQMLQNWEPHFEKYYSSSKLWRTVCTSSKTEVSR